MVRYSSTRQCVEACRFWVQKVKGQGYDVGRVSVDLHVCVDDGDDHDYDDDHDHYD